MRQLCYYLIVSIEIAIIMLLMPLIAFPLYNDIKLGVITINFRKSFDSYELSPQTRVVDVHQEIAGPYSSNYCAPFTGILLETKLSCEDIKKIYNDDFHMAFAWINNDTIKVNYFGQYFQYSFNDCRSCFPKGIRKMIEQHKLSDAGNYFVVVFKEYQYYTEFDSRCH